MIIKNFSYIDDLKKNYSSILNSIKKVLLSENLILGPEVTKFEKNFSKFLRTKYGLA